METWQCWDETRWAAEDTLAVFDAARVSNREAAVAAADPKVAAIVSAAKTVAAVERLARADRAHAATPAQWDADPMLLNTPGGTVELRTGELRPHRRADYCTKRTTVTPGGEAPQWDAFLDWATGGDGELYAFLRRMFGYCLTGLTTEHALFFNHGGGGNGKGTALNTVTRIIGDYAKVAPMETFTASHGERHPTELAMLRGARLVTCAGDRGGPSLGGESHQGVDRGRPDQRAVHARRLLHVSSPSSSSSSRAITARSFGTSMRRGAGDST